MPDTSPPAAALSDSADGPNPEAPPVAATAPVRELVEADLLVEDVSIDGMCGVY